MSELASDAKGVFVIAPTPFHDDGGIDTSATDRPWVSVSRRAPLASSRSA